MLLLLLSSLATAIIGLTGYVIFGPLTYRHQMDRRITVGPSSFAPPFWLWLLRRGWRAHADRNLTGLAVPAWIMLLVIIIGLLGCLLWIVLEQWT